jgi:hypothetical protein
MPAATDFPAVGKVLSASDGAVLFQPLGTTYELRLEALGESRLPPGKRIRVLIRATARKLWTVPSGGNFIVPIAGPPRIVQGRIKYLDDAQMVLHAAAPVIVELPREESAYDLACGPLRVGSLVNVTILSGARIELLSDLSPLTGR